MSTLPKGVQINRQLPPPRPHQRRPAFDTAELRRLSPIQRRNVITHLARMLMLAAGAARERDDDQH
jgi:hypothetical protein